MNKNVFTPPEKREQLFDSLMSSVKTEFGIPDETIKRDSEGYADLLLEMGDLPQEERDEFVQYLVEQGFTMKGLLDEIARAPRKLPSEDELY